VRGLTSTSTPLLKERDVIPFSLRRRVRDEVISFIIIAFLIAGCRPNNPSTSASIIWQNNKAIGLSIPKSLLGDNSLDHLQIRLVKPGERFAVLGNFTINQDQVEFAPVVPLTRGFLYEVLLNDSLLKEIEIPVNESVVAPEIISVYPTQDSVPENLLKIFIHFSQPMVEGQSLRHITLIKIFRIH
jgi:flagellar assembly factor FliW